MYNFHSLGIDTNGRTSGRFKTICPKCHDTRKNKRDKSLSINIDEGMGKCHYCGWNFKLNDETLGGESRPSGLYGNSQRSGRNIPYKPSQLPAHFRRPTFDHNRTALSERVIRWFVETRCIPQSVVLQLRITEQQELMPQTGRCENCICFNYFEGDELVNVKYRDGAKNFKMVSGAELIPYNLNGILGTSQCIVTEGEIDAASLMAIGRTDVVSVPSGANSNLTWLDRFMESHFEDKQLILIAVDTDRKGLELRAELLRRFGPERCRIVTYGPECKDANEHLVRYGAESLRIALEQAEEIPLEGVFTANDLDAELRALYENGFGRGADTGWANLDALCTFELNRQVIISGIPGAGKSEWVDELVLRLCLRHNWRVAFFSPENMPLVYHLRKLAEKLTARRFTPSFTSGEEYHRIGHFLSGHVYHILPKDDFTPDAVLAKARELVCRKGIRLLVIDPLNRLEHAITQGQTETQYLSSLLNKLSGFAIRNHCLVILVAHPRKMNRNPLTGHTPRPGMYDINGSAEFYNKADFGMVVERDNEAGVVRVHVEKVKFKHLGQPGQVSFVYDVVNGRYSPCEEDTNPQTPPERRVRNTVFDTSSWLLPEEDQGTQGILEL